MQLRWGDPAAPAGDDGFSEAGGLEVRNRSDSHIRWIRPALILRLPDRRCFHRDPTQQLSHLQCQ
jgi:hypothetical protein